MKKELYILLLMLGACLSSSAQKNFWYGASAGVQNTLLSSRAGSEIDVKNAYRPFSTLDLEYRVSPRIAIQSGLGYALYTQNTSKYKNNFNYLLVPLYIKVGRFKGNRKYSMSTLFGLNNKFLLSANNIHEGRRSNISSFTRIMHIDVTIGLGLKYKLRDNLILESHVTGGLGHGLNQSSWDRFSLSNQNYGMVFSLKYSLFN